MKKFIYQHLTIFNIIIYNYIYNTYLKKFYHFAVIKFTENHNF